MSKVLLSVLPMLTLLLNNNSSAHEPQTENKSIFDIPSDLGKKIFSKIITSMLLITLLVISLTRLVLAAENYLIASAENGQAIANTIYFFLIFSTLVVAYTLRAKSTAKLNKETQTINKDPLSNHPSLEKLLIEFISGFQEGLKKNDVTAEPPPINNVYPHPTQSNPRTI